MLDTIFTYICWFFVGITVLYMALYGLCLHVSSLDFQEHDIEFDRGAFYAFVVFACSVVGLIVFR